ncbi:MAG: apolipoprotein N-acyltransferase [Bacteroidetes bacterium]|nr:apolipoprotein N-acyltransferase [Bacteroidota bacterium]
MKKIHLVLLSVLSGLLFTAGWPVNGFPAFLFTAFVPLLIIEEHILKNKNSFTRFSVFFYTYPAFLIWNVATTWWIWNSTPVATLAWIFNSMFMSIVLNVYHAIRKNLYKKSQGYFLLIFLWIGFEYFHLNWKLTWPWLNLGNGFAGQYKWIQWYEYSGTLGGTFWILLANILIYKSIKPFLMRLPDRKASIQNGIGAIVVILIPVLFSIFRYYSYREEINPVSVIVCQPNLDPYSTQYTTPPLEAIDISFDLALSVWDRVPAYIVSPESAIQEDIWESNMDASPSLNKLKEFTKNYPDLKIIIGASTFKRYSDSEKLPNSARFHKYANFYYDSYNTAFYVDSAGIFQIHHKSKLTPGVEYMPSGGIFKFLEKYAIDLGGTVGTLGRDENPLPFQTGQQTGVGPVICYESVYGDFCRDYVQKGADALFIITNDGWWGNSPGHKQHLSYASLRAIETRRSIARSANTGISCFVNQRGDIQQATKYWERDVIKQEINLNSEITFYAKFGDFFGRISSFISVLFILLAIVFGLRKKKQFME